MAYIIQDNQLFFFFFKDLKFSLCYDFNSLYVPILKLNRMEKVPTD